MIKNRHRRCSDIQHRRHPTPINISSGNVKRQCPLAPGRSTAEVKVQRIPVSQHKRWATLATRPHLVFFAHNAPKHEQLEISRQRGTAARQFLDGVDCEDAVSALRYSPCIRSAHGRVSGFSVFDTHVTPLERERIWLLHFCGGEEG